MVKQKRYYYMTIARLTPSGCEEWVTAVTDEHPALYIERRDKKTGQGSFLVNHIELSAEEYCKLIDLMNETT